MDLLDLLRVLTLAARLLLAVALLILVSGKLGRLEPTAWRAWLATTITFTVFVADNVVLEVLAAATRDLPEAAALERTREVFYNGTYLLHAVLSAALPAALIGLAAAGWRRAAGWLAAGAAAAAGFAALAAGALESWDVLLDWTRLLSFMAIPAYLAFLGLVLLGHLSALDRYLAWFMGVRAVFVILIPIQEVYFQSVGREAAGQLWHVSQFLQFATGVIHLGLVLLLLRALASGRAAAGAQVGAPAPDARSGW